MSSLYLRLFASQVYSLFRPTSSPSSSCNRIRSSHPCRDQYSLYNHYTGTLTESLFLSCLSFSVPAYNQLRDLLAGCSSFSLANDPILRDACFYYIHHCVAWARMRAVGRFSFCHHSVIERERALFFGAPTITLQKPIRLRLIERSTTRTSAD